MRSVKSMMFIAVAAAALLAIHGRTTLADSLTVSPANMQNWTLNTFDNTGAIANTGGTAAMVYGPATAPLGIGSAELATPTPAPTDTVGSAAAIATEQFDGIKLASITSLGYSAYDAANNGQQFPYLAISVSNDGSGDPATLDTLFFEPPYQTPGANGLPDTGPGSVPDQGDTTMNLWQPWNALVGAFWDNNGVLGFGGVGGVQPLSSYLTAFPNATITNGGYPGLGGIALQVGFDGTANQGYVDNFSIGISGATTTYNFDPVPVPLPSAAGVGFSILGGLGAVTLVRKRLARKFGLIA